MRRSVLGIGLVAALAALLAACGGDDALSAEEYFEGLEAVGAQSDAQAEPLFEPFADDAPPDAETAAAFLVGYQALFEAARAGTVELAPRAIWRRHTTPPWRR